MSTQRKRGRPTIMKHYDNPMESPMAHLSLKMQKIDTNSLAKPTMKVGINSIRDLNNPNSTSTNNAILKKNNNFSNVNNSNSSRSSRSSSSSSSCDNKLLDNDNDNNLHTPIKKKGKNIMLQTPISNNKLLNSHTNNTGKFNKKAICKNGRYRGIIISSPKKRLTLDLNFVTNNKDKIKFKTTTKEEFKEIHEEEATKQTDTDIVKQEEKLEEGEKEKAKENDFLLTPLQQRTYYRTNSNKNNFHLSLNINNKGFATINNQINSSSPNTNPSTFLSLYSPIKKSNLEFYLKTPTFQNKSRLNSINFNFNSNSINNNQNNDLISNNNKVFFNSPVQLINLNNFSPLQDSIILDKDRQSFLNYINNNQTTSSITDNNHTNHYVNFSTNTNTNIDVSSNKVFSSFVNLPTATRTNPNILLSPRNSTFNPNSLLVRNVSMVSPLKQFFDIDNNNNNNNSDNNQNHNHNDALNNHNNDFNDNSSNIDDARLALQSLINH